MPALPPAPTLDAEAIGRCVREAEAALCRVHASASAIMSLKMSRLAAEPLHALGLARAASVALVDDSEPFYLRPPGHREGPECVNVPDLPAKQRDATPEHWARLMADLDAADQILAGLVRAFARHPHVSDQWGDVALFLDGFLGAVIATRSRANSRRKRRGPKAGAKPRASHGGGPLVNVELL